MLGVDGDDLLLEVLGDPALPWVDAQLPEGWRDRSPWRQPGWLAATVDRLDAALGAAGVRRTGQVVQAKHWSISALVSAPTDQGTVWFKQVPPMFAHEGRLNAWLADVAPDAVARPLAVGDDWWIARDLGAERDVPPDKELGAMEFLADLQELTVGRSAELLALGCPDRRPVTVLPALEQVTGREDCLPPEVAEQLRALLPALGEVIERLCGSGLPDTLVHGDFHGGNTRFTDTGWVVYDWTDGCLSHPLVDLAPAALHPEPRAVRLPEADRLWRRRFSGLPEDAVWCGLVAGAAHQVVTYQRIADGVEPTSAGMWATEGTECAQALISLLQV